MTKKLVHHLERDSFVYLLLFFQMKFTLIEIIPIVNDFAAKFN